MEYAAEVLCIGFSFRYPSIDDARGLVVKETMIRGFPVLASKISGVTPTLLLECINGWTFNPFSIEQILKSCAK